jgi:gliding motility-associated-like protein
MLPRGNYVLKPIAGSDGNTLVDLCGQPQLLADEQPFKAGTSLQVNIGADTVFCPGTRFLLQARFLPASTAIQTYAWKPAAAFVNATVATPQFIATANTVVSLEATTVNGCTATSPVKRINRGRFPVVEAGPEVSVPAGLPVQLQGWVDDPMAVINWSPANGVSNARTLTPLARSLQKRWYYLTATNQAGCSSYDSVWVNAYRLEVPNAFSPNGDGIHDLWVIPELKAYTAAAVEVFNRWGQPVFHSTGYNKPWDGSFAGSPLPAGVYYFIVNPNIMGYDPFTGSITLIR